MSYLRLCAKYILILIILLAAVLRFYQLGTTPAGYTWDEAVITYDAWGIADWHRDQYVNFMPLTFQSFGDYKAPLLHYVLGTVFKIVEPNMLMIRIVSALSGILLVLGVYFLARKLLNHRVIALIAAFAAAISPWNVHMSRVGFEANLATTLVVFGVLGLLMQRSIFKLGGVGLLALSLYTYQSPKMVIPLLLVLITAWIIRQKYLSRRHGLVFLIIFGLLCLPLVSTLDQGGGTRASQALLFFTNGELSFQGDDVRLLMRNLFGHLSPEYWVLGVQDSLRNIVPGYGIVYWVSLVFIMFGIVTLYINSRRVFWLLFIWLGLGLLPSLLSRIGPHTLRSALIQPVIYLVEGYGIWRFYKYVATRYAQYRYLIGGIIFVAYIGFFGGFLHYYFGQYRTDAALDFQYGYFEALSVAREEMRSASNLVVTDAYGQPYVYTLLAFKYTPEQFTQGALANVAFYPINSLDKENTVFVGTPDEIDVDNEYVKDVIYLPSSDVPVFVIARTP